MTKGQKSAAVRYWNRGMTADQIAAHFGISVRTVADFLSSRPGWPSRPLPSRYRSDKSKREAEAQSRRGRPASAKPSGSALRAAPEGKPAAAAVPYVNGARVSLERAPDVPPVSLPYLRFLDGYDHSWRNRVRFVAVHLER